MDERVLMQRISNTLHNASQSEWITKDHVLDAIKNVLIDYNNRVIEGLKVPINDFRK